MSEQEREVICGIYCPAPCHYQQNLAGQYGLKCLHRLVVFFCVLLQLSLPFLQCVVFSVRAIVLLSVWDSLT